MKACNNCGTEFEDNGKGKLYCNSICQNRAKSKRHYDRFGIWLDKDDRNKEHKCKKCNSDFNPTRRNQKYCSAECSSESQRKYLDIPQCLEEASRKLDKKIGYVRVYCPMHPEANTWGYVYEHRLIMESIIGRHLTKQEHIHHINGKRWDNNPENLQIMSPSDHSKLSKSS